jgi:Flp pilus assembly protein TadG
MRKDRHREAGIGLLEILLAGTILLFVMLGMNAALLSSSLVSMKSKDVTLATNLAQQLIEDERRRCLDPAYFANLPATATENMYTVTGSTDPYMRRYVRRRLASPPSVVTTRDTNPGNNVVVKINVPPSTAGISAGSRVTLFWPATGARQTVYAVNPNDNAVQFLVDDTAPQQGRQGLTNAFPAGTLVLVGSKLLTVQIGVAAPDNASAMASGRTPLITLSTYVNNPLQ